MGAWGHDSFENDDALDWVSNDFEGSDDLSAVAEALETVASWGEGDYLELPECGAAVAAAEVLAAVLRHPSPTLPEDIAAWVAEHSFDDARSFVPTAQQAIDRIERDSEMQELWDESDDATQWRKSMAELKSRLKT